MEITEVRIKIVSQTQDRLLGFCSLTFDDAFVVRDLKIIQGAERPFVAMPSRKLTDRCRRCSGKNPYRANFCNQCGSKLHDTRAPRNPDGRAKLYADIAHPINSACREMIQVAVLLAFEEEKVLAMQPGYVSRYDDFGEESTGDYDEYPENPPVLRGESLGKVAGDSGVGGQKQDASAATCGGASEASPSSGAVADLPSGVKSDLPIDASARHATPPAPHCNITGKSHEIARERESVSIREPSPAVDSVPDRPQSCDRDADAGDEFGAGLR